MRVYAPPCHFALHCWVLASISPSAPLFTLSPTCELERLQYEPMDAPLAVVFKTCAELYDQAVCSTLVKVCANSPRMIDTSAL